MPARVLLRTVVATAFASLFAWSVPVAAQNPFVLKIGTALNAGSIADIELTEFKRRLEAEMPGAFDIQLFYSSALGQPMDVYEGMKIGTHQAELTATPLSNINKRIAVFELPYLFKDRADIGAKLNGRLGDLLKEGMAGSGMTLVAFWEGGYRSITNRQRPIVKPEDMNGLKIRVPNSRFRVEAFRAFGASPTPIDFAELYSALDQGIVDGQENPLQIVTSAKFTEVQRYLSVSNHVYFPLFLVVAHQVLERMEPNMREKFVEVAKSMEGWSRDQGQQADERELAQLKEKMEVNETDFEAFQKASSPLYQSPLFINAIGKDTIKAATAAE